MQAAWALWHILIPTRWPVFGPLRRFCLLRPRSYLPRSHGDPSGNSEALEGLSFGPPPLPLVAYLDSQPSCLHEQGKIVCKDRYRR
jgi:hypothetical protein